MDSRLPTVFLASIFNPVAFSGSDFVAEELTGLAEWIKSSKTQAGFDRIMLPVEPENAARKVRSDYVEMDKVTWEKLCTLAVKTGVDVPLIRP